MRIMLDTNVLVSALLFPGSTINAIMKKVTANHSLVLSSYIEHNARYTPFELVLEL